MGAEPSYKPYDLTDFADSGDRESQPGCLQRPLCSDFDIIWVSVRWGRFGPVPGTGLWGGRGDGVRLPLVMQIPQNSLAGRVLCIPGISEATSEGLQQEFSAQPLSEGG